jgi:hypothetical protein
MKPAIAMPDVRGTTGGAIGIGGIPGPIPYIPPGGGIGGGPPIGDIARFVPHDEQNVAPALRTAPHFGQFIDHPFERRQS